MRRTTKMLIASAAIGFGVLLGFFLVVLSQVDDVGEDEVRAMVSDRYGGEVDTIRSEGDSYIVMMKDGDYEYEITVDQDNGEILDMASEKVTEEESAGEAPEETEATEAKGQAEQDGDGAEPEEEPSVISEEEAKNIAFQEVGGLFIHATMNESTHPVEYQIIQLVDDDDEGALVSVNAQSGEVEKILWFEIDFEDIVDMEAFAQELQTYNEQYQNNYYIEFDDYYDD